MPAPVITDPTAPRLLNTFLAQPFRSWVRDERDLVFVQLSIIMIAIFVPAAVFSFMPGMFRWWMAPVYWALHLFFLGPFILMLHNTSHRILFKREYDGLNKVIPWLVGPLLGQSPETYFAHHLGMHHAEGNLPADLSSTMRYQRDSFIDFLKYFFRFLFCHPFLIRYYFRAGRPKLARRFIAGEVAHFSVVALLLMVSWQAALVVFVVPLLVTRFMLMSGNWAQHAFVDPDDPTNDYKTVTTFINSGYNHRCFNDGYHLGHHLKPARHWLEMPDDFLAKQSELAAQGSLVFRKIDYFVIFWLLMLKRYRTLARFYVNLREKPMSSDEIVALLKKRVQRFDAEQLAAMGEPALASA